MRPAADDDELDFAWSRTRRAWTTRCGCSGPAGTCLLFAAEAAPRAVDLDRVYRVELVAARRAIVDAGRPARARSSSSAAARSASPTW